MPYLIILIASLPRHPSFIIGVCVQGIKRFANRSSYNDFRTMFEQQWQKLSYQKRKFCVGWKHRYEAFFRGLTLNFSRMLGIFIAGSPGEMSYSEKFQIVFKKLMCCE